METFIIDRPNQKDLKLNGKLLAKSEINNCNITVYLTEANNFVCVEKYKQGYNETAVKTAVYLRPEKIIDILQYSGAAKEIYKQLELPSSLYQEIIT